MGLTGWQPSGRCGAAHAREIARALVGEHAAPARVAGLHLCSSPGCFGLRGPLYVIAFSLRRREIVTYRSELKAAKKKARVWSRRLPKRSGSTWWQTESMARAVWEERASPGTPQTEQ